MLQYIWRRVMAAIPTLFIILVVGFIIMELPPGDYVTFEVQRLLAEGYDSAHEEAEMLTRRYALDRPVYERFVKWMWRFIQGDFGESFAYRKPVRDLIGERLALTLVLTATSLFISWAIGIPVGVYSATHQYKLGDHIFTVIAFVGVGVPSFFLALVLLVAGMKLFGFVPAGLFSPTFQSAPWSLAKVADLLKHIWVPAIIVAVTSTAGHIRQMRGNLLDVLRLPYIQTARAKGVKERTLVWKYGVRNAIHPLVMSMGTALPGLISGSALVGIVLNLPVMGPLYLEAVRRQDIYLGGTFLILVTFLLVLGNLLADIALALVDPRVRYD